MIAARNNDRDMIKYLLDSHNPKLFLKNYYDNDVMDYAVSNTDIETIKYIKEKGYNKNFKPEHLYTTYKRYGPNNYPLYKLLINNGADVRDSLYINNLDENFLEFILCDKSHGLDIKFFKYILEKALEMDANEGKHYESLMITGPYYDGTTTLLTSYIFCVEEIDLDIVKLIISKWPDIIFIRDRSGKNILMKLCEKYNLEEYGKQNIRINFEKSINLLVNYIKKQFGKEKLRDFINLSDNNEETALELLENRSYKLAKLLVENGAYISNKILEEFD